MGIFVCFFKTCSILLDIFKNAFIALLLWRQDYEAMLISFLYWLNTNTLVQCCILQSLFSKLCCFYSTHRKRRKIDIQNRDLSLCYSNRTHWLASLQIVFVYLVCNDSKPVMVLISKVPSGLQTFREAAIPLADLKFPY